jgi:hypothetical protein
MMVICLVICLGKGGCGRLSGVLRSAVPGGCQVPSARAIKDKEDKVEYAVFR